MCLQIVGQVTRFSPQMIHPSATNSRTALALFYVGIEEGNWLGSLQFPWLLDIPSVHLAAQDPICFAWT